MCFFGRTCHTSYGNVLHVLPEGWVHPTKRTWPCACVDMTMWSCLLGHVLLLTKELSSSLSSREKHTWRKWRRTFASSLRRTEIIFKPGSNETTQISDFILPFIIWDLLTSNLLGKFFSVSYQQHLGEWKIILSAYAHPQIQHRRHNIFALYSYSQNITSLDCVLCESPQKEQHCFFKKKQPWRASWLGQPGTNPQKQRNSNSNLHNSGNQQNSLN